MHGSDELTRATRLLVGIENGRITRTEARILAEDLDPVYVYVIVSFLRAVHPAGDPAATAVLERVLELITGDLVRKYKEGGRDPVSRWFESDHGFAGFRGRGTDMLALVAEKLD